MKDGKRLLQLGCGLYGSFVAGRLLETGAFSSVTLADINLDTAEGLAKKLRAQGHEVTATAVDAANRDSLIRLYRGFDLIANITGDYEHTALPAVDAAIATGIDYIDINADFPSTKLVLERDADARKAGVTVLIGFGDTPGIINIFARHAADQLDQVEELHFAAGGSAGFHNADGVERILKKIISDPAVIYRQGALTEAPACTEKERIRLVAGVDEEFEVMLARQPMVLTIPRHIAHVREVSYKIGFTPTALGNDIVCALRNWGMHSNVPIDVKGQQVIPLEFTAAFLASDAHVKLLKLRDLPMLSGFHVRARGRKDGKPVSITYRLRDAKGTLTQSTCACAAHLLVDGKIPLKGVLAPEALNPKPFIEMAHREGLMIEESSDRVW